MKKVCIKCNIEKELINNFSFRKDTNKYRNDCVQCRNGQSKQYYLDNIEEQKIYRKEYYYNIYKFNNEQIQKKEIYRKEWEKLNPDKVKCKRNKYRKSEKGIETENQYYLNNKKDYNARSAKRRAQKIKATPTWADLNKIKDIYRQCPKGYEVDHIVPLQGKHVSGLHVDYNLQYLKKEDNRIKGNKYGT